MLVAWSVCAGILGLLGLIRSSLIYGRILEDVNKTLPPEKRIALIGERPGLYQHVISLHAARFPDSSDRARMRRYKVLGLISWSTAFCRGGCGLRTAIRRRNRNPIRRDLSGANRRIGHGERSGCRAVGSTSGIPGTWRLVVTT